MKALFLFFLLTITSVVLNADYILKYKLDNQPFVFIYQDDDHMKLVVEASKNSISEVYYIKGKTYNITDTNGMLVKVDVDKVKQNMENFGISISGNVEEKKPNYKIVKTGKEKTVGGIKGEVWIVKDPQSNEKYEVVVSNDKTLNKLTNRMFKLFVAFSGGGTNYFEIKKGYVAIEGDGVKLISLKRVFIKRKDFTLPTKSRTKPQVEEVDFQNQAIKEDRTQSKEKKISPHDSKRTKKDNEQDEKELQNAVNLLKSFF
jgi:hypothetical protein